MANVHRVEPGPGQESVWDYPRPPRVERTAKQIRVVFNGVTVAETRRAQRVLETSHPPVYYIPTEDVQMDNLVPTARTSLCEWKGQARYYTVRVGARLGSWPDCRTDTVAIPDVALTSGQGLTTNPSRSGTSGP